MCRSWGPRTHAAWLGLDHIRRRACVSRVWRPILTGTAPGSNQSRHQFQAEAGLSTAEKPGSDSPAREIAPLRCQRRALYPADVLAARNGKWRRRVCSIPRTTNWCLSIYVGARCRRTSGAAITLSHRSGRPDDGKPRRWIARRPGLYPNNSRALMESARAPRLQQLPACSDMLGNVAGVR